MIAQLPPPTRHLARKSGGDYRLLLDILIEGGDAAKSSFAFVHGRICLLIQVVEFHRCFWMEKGYTHADMYRMVVELRDMDFIYLVKDMLNMLQGTFLIRNINHVDGKFIST